VICELRLQMRNLLIQLLSSALSFTAGNVSICRHGLCLPEKQTTLWRESYFGGGHLLEGANISEAFNNLGGMDILKVMRSKS